MTAPTSDAVKAYYDERVEGKLRDFTEFNPRIEGAIETLAEWAPMKPKRILEIGCGIGATSWRMARAWPQAEVFGMDISPISIEVAQKCFQRPNLTFRAGLIKEGVLEGKFDLILLMDVYEHIAPQDRPTLHAAIRSLLSDDSRVVMTVPTPAILKYILDQDPNGLQPVDEDITINEIATFAQETKTEHLFYRKVGIWRYGDYAHHIFGRYQELADVAMREIIPYTGRRQQIKRLVGIVRRQGRRDYLGTDLCRPAQRDLRNRFRVSRAKRRRCVAAWLKQSGHLEEGR